MAHGRYFHRSISGESSEDFAPKYLGIDSSHHLDLDDIKFVDNFQDSGTIKRLSFKRQPRGAVNHAGKTQTSVSRNQWHSDESLSSPSSDDSRKPAMASTTRGRPPLPPPHGSSLDNKVSRNEGAAKIQAPAESTPQPAARSLPSHKPSPVAERTASETNKNSEHEVNSRSPPQPQPRRRLASFGGVSSPGSPSPFTGLGAYDQNNNGNKPADGPLNSSLGSRGSTGNLRSSPHSSGRSTPVAGLGSMQLQQVRDQMVVALQRLKELEEQIKIIPILQVKISVLQEEKRQLVSQIKHQGGNEDTSDVTWGKARPAEVSDSSENRVNTDEESNSIALEGFKKLSEEVQTLEKTIKGGHLQTLCGKGNSPQFDHVNPDVRDTHISLSRQVKENKHMHGNKMDTRSIATEVTEAHLGISTDKDEEIEIQQLIIDALKERISHLEAELKESALQTEMSRLKLELQAAGARSRADKATLAVPSTVSTGVEARPQSTSQGVGNHTEVKDAGTGEARPELRHVCMGPDLPMSHWEVRKRVQTREMGVGSQIFTTTQGTVTEMKVRDAETNTEAPLETKTYRSVACGDCSVHVIVSEPKELVTEGMCTDPVRRADLGIMASPLTASQRTNTISSSVSRFTNTKQAFSTDSSTNTLLSTQDKHTNTAQTVTRSVFVGNRVRDTKCGTETRTIGVNTTTLFGNALKPTSGTGTRDTGVGLTSIYENFLVGLKTRNMASGSSHLPDPVNTKSIGVGEGRVRNLTVSCSASAQSFQPSAQSQWDPELNHYIEKMQKLLGEDGDLLSETCTQPGSNSSKLSYDKNTAAEVHRLTCQPLVGNEFPTPPELPVQSSKCDEPDSGVIQHESVKKMIQMLEQQTSSAQQERSANVQRPVKKQKSDQGCSNSRKSMKLLKVTTGLEPLLSYEHLVEERSGSGDVEGKRGHKKTRGSSQDAAPARKGRSGSSKGAKGSAKSQTQQRFKLSEKVFAACQALKIHLSEEKRLSSRELNDCQQSLQQEWFSMTSHKSAAPDFVDEYLSAFGVISPSVLQHVTNMTDDNGNTALHYSVSHSNFGIVKKLLDAGVCNINQQNKAGYTPVMLAALASVESPEDMRVVEQLFTKGEVNAKASQAGQTALMLAVSHGRMAMVQALLAQGAEVNLQDDEGSTALMCASEHGHTDIVKLLLAQPHCDATLTDNDESTALSIALEAGHHDIAVLLYAHANFSKAQAVAAARHGGKSISSPGGSDRLTVNLE